MLKFSILASGSKGNSTYIEMGSSKILLDAGLSARKLTERLAVIGREPRDITAIFLTHEHSDHASGVKVFSKKNKIPVFGTRGTRENVLRRFGKIDSYRYIEQEDEVVLNGLRVQSYPTPHDAQESVAYVVEAHGQRIGFATDLGSITEQVRNKLGKCDGLFLEANHDETMLMEGPYPWPLKQRILGEWGHLSNAACADLLASVYHGGLRATVLMHLSEHNNTPQKALDAVRGVVPESLPLYIAPQHQPTPLQILDDLGAPPSNQAGQQMALAF